MSFDEGLLDEPARLEQRDASRLLWSLASAGPQVRRALDTAGDFRVASLRGDDAPRALLIAVDAAPSSPARLLARLSEPRTPALVWDEAQLPRWAGPADALLVGSVDGRSPRLAELVSQAAQRGLAVAVAAPERSLVASAAGRAALAELPTDLHPAAGRWAVLAPLLQALDALGAAEVPAETLVEICDALEGAAETCRVQSELFTNPAKALALELAESTALVVGAGALAGVAATTFVDALQRYAGTVGAALTLPRDAERVAALLRGEGEQAVDPDDFFRDRTEESAERHPRLLLIGTDGAPEDPQLAGSVDGSRRVGEFAARQAASALDRLATALGRRSSTVATPDGDPLARFAAATAFGDFTAAYLGLGLGLDPGAPTLIDVDLP